MCVAGTFDVHTGVSGVCSSYLALLKETKICIIERTFML